MKRIFYKLFSPKHFLQRELGLITLLMACIDMKVKREQVKNRWRIQMYEI